MLFACCHLTLLGLQMSLNLVSYRQLKAKEDNTVANHKSAAKRARQTTTRTLRNRVVTSESRTVIKKIRSAIEAKDKETASGLLSAVQRQLGLMAKKGIIKTNSAGRRTSRLASQINGL